MTCIVCGKLMVLTARNWTGEKWVCSCGNEEFL
jgi:hypothetical protein